MRATRTVTLQDLLAAHPLKARFVLEHEQVVTDIVLVSDVEEILGVGPDSIVLLGSGPPLGGWVVSVALRYAWERHAAAVVIADQPLSDSVVELARRFGISLLETGDEVARTALALARGLGALEAGMLVRLDALHERFVRARDLREMIADLSQELSGARVEILIAGISAQKTGHRAAAAVQVRQPLGSHGRDQYLVAWTLPRDQEFARRALARAIPSVRTLLLEQELRDHLRAAPLRALAALGPHARTSPLPNDVLVLGGEDGAGRIAAAFRVDGPHADEIASGLAPLVASRWRATFPRVPLARESASWLAVIPIHTTTGKELILRRVQQVSKAVPVLSVGFSVDGVGDVPPEVLLRRAQLASGLAEPGVALDFERIGLPLLRRMLTWDDARILAEATLPELLADPQAATLITTVRAYLDEAGSVGGAADRLRVHRNTLKQRLSRAAALGVPLDDPDRLLGAYLLLTAVDPTAAHPDDWSGTDENDELG